MIFFPKLNIHIPNLHKNNGINKKTIQVENKKMKKTREVKRGILRETI